MLHAHKVQVFRPCYIRRHVLQVADRFLIIIADRVAKRCQLARCGCQLCFHSQYRFRLFLSLLIINAHQREHPGDVYRISGTHLQCAGIGLKVVIPVRHSQPSLRHHIRFHIAMLRVLRYTLIKEYVGAIGMHMCRYCQYIFFCFYRGYLVQLRAQWLYPVLFYRSSIHSAIPEISYLLAGAGLVASLQCFLVYFQQFVTQFFFYQLANAIRGFIRRNRIPFHPAAISVGKEVIVWPYRSIHVVTDNIAFGLFFWCRLITCGK